MRYFFYAIAAFSVFQGTARAQAFETFPFPSNGVTIGNGWLGNEGVKTSEVCVVAETSQLAGERRKLDYTELTDTSTLMRALSISAKAKANSILGGSASASFNYDRTVTLKRDSLQILVDFSVQKGSTYLVPKENAIGSGERAIMLRPALVDLARNNPLEFRRRCGDGYVATVVRRAGLWGIYTFVTRSDEERLDIKGKMKGSFGTFSASASTRDLTQKFEKSGRLSIQYLQEGGEGLLVPTSDAAFRQLVEKMGTETGTPVESQIVVASYNSLPNFPASGRASESAAGDLADQYFRLSTLSQSINEILKIGLQNSYTTSETKVRALQDAIRLEMGRIQNALRACVSSSLPCTYPANLSKDDYRFRAQMPIELSTIPGWESHFSMIDQIFQQESRKITGPENYDAVMRGASERVQAVREGMKKAELDARYRFWLLEPNAARCDRNESDVCILNSEMDQYRSQLMN